MTVTEQMKKAGKNLASNLYDASISKAMGGLGGCKTLDEWLDEEVPNRDIILLYLEEKIDSVTAIYMAMERAKE